MFRCGLCLSVFLLAALLSARADSVTNAPNQAGRPKIGLVLGGGGALGIAHVGVLRVLEELHIPVDYIGGTSMGSIIAGLYAAGLSPDEIEDVLVNLDWWDVMKDRTSYRDLDFRRKQESARYLMDLELGVRGTRIVFPFGFAAGQKFNNLMQELTFNQAGKDSFDDLNIPFRAVATDLRSGEAVVLDHGNLATAMRASMAVPGVFTPVEFEGHLMVDGGLVNNIPVDVVKAMGADIIIAVDVGASGVKAGQAAQFNSLGQIVGRTYAIMQRPKDEIRREAADILIEPDLVGLAAGDFHRAGELVPRGLTAAQALTNELRQLAVDDATYAAWRQNQRTQREEELAIRSVSVEGNRIVPTPMILKRITTKPGGKVTMRQLRKDVGSVYGIGDFLTVTHRLVPTGKPGEYDLKFETVEKYWGPTYMHFGLRLESGTHSASSWSMLLNVRRSELNDLGGELEADLEAGRRQRGFLEWYQPLQNRGYVFVAPAVEASSETQDIYDGSDKIAEYRKDLSAGRFDVGTQQKQYGEFRVGVMAGKLEASPEVGAVDLPDVSPQLGAYTTRVTLDRLDAAVFPRHGTYLGLNGHFSSEDLGADDEYDKLDFALRWLGSRGEHTLGLNFISGSSLGSDVPVYDEYVIGGMLTLPGLPIGALRGSYYDVAGISYRYRIGRLSPSLGQGIYAISGLNAGNTWDEASDIDVNDVIVGGMAGLALDTIMGPIAVAGGWAEGGRSQVYLTVGTLF